MSFNLATILRASATAAPEDTVVSFGGCAITYRELDELSGRFAVGLGEAGLAPGAVVALQLPNRPEFLVAYFGSLKAGMTVLPLNPLLKAPEIRYHLDDSGAAILLACEPFLAEALDAAAPARVPVYALDPSSGTSGDVLPFARLMSGTPFVEPGGGVHPTNPDDTAVLIYTSGTTGRPKGAELTHFQLYMNCTVAGEMFGETRDDVSLAVLPFFHVFGLSTVNVAVRYGAGLSVLPRFEPKAVLDAIEADGVTVILGVPTMLHALADCDVSGRDLGRLRVAGCGGASLPEDVMRTFEERFGIVVLEGYGLSETASTCSFNTSATDRRPLSVGRPIWGVEMAVMGTAGELLPAGAGNVGEIVVRGHNVMKGYLGRPEVTAEALRGGWFHTGDLGHVDEDGFFFVVDRIKDLVIRGGYNVYPREIEEVLFAHPDIAEAAVIGVPDQRLGEEVVAVVVVREGATLGAADVVEYCRERLAAYKYPRVVRFLPALPKGPTGKILKTALRAG